jgi:hypothetical protein
MVRAEKTTESIRDALARGDFYATTGVILEAARRDGDRYEVIVAEESEGDHTIALIESGGKVAVGIDARRAEFDLSDRTGYVRVVVRSSTGASAWAQPVMLPRPEQ